MTKRHWPKIAVRKSRIAKALAKTFDMSASGRIAALLLAGLGLGVAHAGLFDDDEARKAILDLRQRIEAVRVESEQRLNSRLAEESRKTAEGEIDAPHPFAWYGRRMRDVHDVWHVLTGYSTDGLGEACVVAFSYSQTKSLGFALIAHAGAYQYEKIRNGHPYRKAVMEAFRNGKRAAWLPEVDYVKLFGETLEAARARLNIQPATIYQSIPEDVRDRPLTRKFDA